MIDNYYDSWYKNWRQKQSGSMLDRRKKLVAGTEMLDLFIKLAKTSERG